MLLQNMDIGIDHFGPGSAGYYSTLHGGLLLLRVAVDHTKMTPSTPQCEARHPDHGGYICLQLTYAKKCMYLALNFYIRWGWNVPNELERRLFLDQKELACQSSGSRYEAKHIFYSHIYIYTIKYILYIYIFASRYLFQHEFICNYILQKFMIVI